MNGNIGLIPVNIYSFLMTHWILSSLLLLVFLAIIIETLLTNTRKKSHLTPGRVVEFMNRQNGRILDIRSEEKFKFGHILGAINIPAFLLNVQIKKLKRYQKFPIIICGEMQQSTAKIEQMLKEKKFDVYTLAQGIDAWKKAGLPLTNKTE